MSPATCVVFAMILNAFIALEGSSESWRRFIRAICAIVLAAIAFRLAAMPAGVPLTGAQPQMSWCCSQYRRSERWPYEQRLRAAAGRHLVIVRYGPSTATYPEWVYNEADIDGSRIVWARDMGQAANRELIRYYPDRRVWLAEPDALPPAICPY